LILDLRIENISLFFGELFGVFVGGEVWFSDREGTTDSDGSGKWSAPCFIAMDAQFCGFTEFGFRKGVHFNEE